MEQTVNNLLPLAGLWSLLMQRMEQMPTLAVAAAVGTPLFFWLTPRLQRLWPRLWPKTDGARRSFVTDLIYMSLSPVIEVFARTCTTAGIALGALAIGHQVSPTLVQGYGPVIAQPRWLMLIEMLILSDFIYYWTHRMAHTIPVLWRLHRVHHSTEHMRFSASARVHPLEVYALVLNMVPLFLLGFPVDALAPLAPLTVLYAMFIHSNVRFAPRRLAYLVNSPAFHRWHHAREYRGHGFNYAGFFPLFDALFGTYHYPNHSPAQVGITQPKVPQTFLGQLAHPFRGGR